MHAGNGLTKAPLISGRGEQREPPVRCGALSGVFYARASFATRRCF